MQGKVVDIIGGTSARGAEDFGAGVVVYAYVCICTCVCVCCGGRMLSSQSLAMEWSLPTIANRGLGLLRAVGARQSEETRPQMHRAQAHKLTA